MLALDYTDPIPGSILKASGITQVFRYVTNPKWPKSLSQPEVDDLRANAIQINLNYEETADFMLSGYTGGLRCAQYARSLANGLGFSPDAPIYYSADFDVTDNQIPVILDFLYGAEFQEKKRYRVGLYGGYKACKMAVAHGYGVWQTAAWSYGQREPKAIAYQTGGQIILAGVTADKNELNPQAIGSTVPLIPKSITDRWPQLTNEFPPNANYDTDTAIIWADAGARYTAEKTDEILNAVRGISVPNQGIGTLSDVDIQRIAKAVVTEIKNDINV
jgi:hypothetical protein